MNRVIAQSFAIAMCLLASSACAAAQVVWKTSSVVGIVPPPLSTILQPGDTVSAIATFDSSVLDQIPADANLGWYPAASFSVQIGSYSLDSSVPGVSANLGIVLNINLPVPGPSDITYLSISARDVNPIMGLSLTHLEFDLAGPKGMLANDSFVSALPNFTLAWSNSDWGSASDRFQEHLVFTNINVSVVTVPITPPSALLLACGFASLIRRRRPMAPSSFGGTKDTHMPPNPYEPPARQEQ